MNGWIQLLSKHKAHMGTLVYKASHDAPAQQASRQKTEMVLTAEHKKRLATLKLKYKLFFNSHYLIPICVIRVLPLLGIRVTVVTIWVVTAHTLRSSNKHLTLCLSNLLPHETSLIKSSSIDMSRVSISSSLVRQLSLALSAMVFSLRGSFIKSPSHWPSPSLLLVVAWACSSFRMFKASIWCVKEQSPMSATCSAA